MILKFRCPFVAGSRWSSQIPQTHWGAGHPLASICQPNMLDPHTWLDVSWTWALGNCVVAVCGGSEHDLGPCRGPSPHAAVCGLGPKERCVAANVSQR